MSNSWADVATSLVRPAPLPASFAYRKASRTRSASTARGTAASSERKCFGAEGVWPSMERPQKCDCEGEGEKFSIGRGALQVMFRPVAALDALHAKRLRTT